MTAPNGGSWRPFSHATKHRYNPRPGDTWCRVCNSVPGEPPHMTTGQRFKSAQFSPDGAWIVDHAGCGSVAEVIERVADQGSRWIFYPIAVVIRDHGPYTTPSQRIVDAPEPFEHWKGRSLGTFARTLAEHTAEVIALLS